MHGFYGNNPGLFDSNMHMAHVQHDNNSTTSRSAKKIRNSPVAL